MNMQQHVLYVFICMYFVQVEYRRASKNKVTVTLAEPRPCLAWLVVGGNVTGNRKTSNSKRQ